MKKRINNTLLAILVCVLMTPLIQVSANNITPRLSTGFKWYYTPRVVYLRCDFTTAERNAVSAAMSTWNAVKDSNGNSMVSMYLTTDTSINNWVMRATTYDGWIGHTDYTAIGDEILGVKVKLASNVEWSTGGAANAYDVQSVVLHELGHALGVAHCHEENSGSCSSATCSTNVMNPYTRVGTRNVTLKAYDRTSYIDIY